MALEKILLAESVGEKDLAVVPREFLFNGEYWSGVRKVSEREMFVLLSKYMEFHERTDELERDERLKQIIPYFLVKKGDKYLIAKRKNMGGDTRLHGTVLIGFGGHLRAEDIRGQMKDWLKREFEEEVSAEKIDEISFLGIVNDDSDANSGVGKVHFGLVFVVEVDGAIELNEKENFEEEKFVAATQLTKMVDEMESWSRLIVSFLAKS